MNSPICELLGIEFPLLAFSHCRDVVAAVSKAGGMGVFGAVTYTPEELRAELAWIEEQVDGKPFGVDLIVPNQMAGKGEAFDASALIAGLPAAQKNFAAELLSNHGIQTDDLDERRADIIQFAQNLGEAGAEEMLEVVFSFPVSLVANALGTPPKIMIEMAHKKNVPVAALVGTKEHAIAQIESGVDILVAAGGEAGGHCGEISTMVLVPEVVEVAGDTPVLAAGGIVTGAQMAAAMAMGAAGAWCGSVWLTTSEAEPAPVIKEKLLAASSRDTVRSKSRTGKYSRQLRSPWTDAWEGSAAPEALPMPMQSLISEPALRKVERLSESGHPGAAELSTYWVGQGVGLMNQEMSAAAVVQEFKHDFTTACERLMRAVE